MRYQTCMRLLHMKTRPARALDPLPHACGDAMCAQSCRECPWPRPRPRPFATHSQGFPHSLHAWRTARCSTVSAPWRQATPGPLRRSPRWSPSAALAGAYRSSSCRAHRWAVHAHTHASALHVHVQTASRTASDAAYACARAAQHANAHAGAYGPPMPRARAHVTLRVRLVGCAGIA